MTRLKLNRPGAMGPGWFVCPTNEINAVLEREWAGLEKTAETVWSSSTASGAIELLAQRAERYADGTTAASLFRRIYDLRRENTVSTKATLAEALLTALDTSTTTERIPTFPGSRAGAMEMVESHLDIKGEEMTELEKQRLARSLMNFAGGYLYCDAEVEEVEVPDEEAA